MLTGVDWQIYAFICQNFFATISKWPIYEIQKVLFRIREEEFTLSGRKLIFKGFLEIAPFLGAKDADVELPQFKDGDTCKI